jgi:hypothetical protein
MGVGVAVLVGVFVRVVVGVAHETLMTLLASTLDMEVPG